MSIMQYTTSGADNLARSAWNLYLAMSERFGDDKAWEFVLKFYEGSGGNG